jgi:hypothetical protein
MKALLEKYLLRGIPRSPDEPAGDGAKPAEGAAPAADGTILANAAKAAAEAAGGDEPKPAAYVYDPAKTQAENDALRKTHDEAEATKIAKAKEAKPADKPAEKKPEEKPGEVDPKSYKLDPPEGFQLDPEVEGEFRGVAAELKLDQAGVDKLKGIQLKLYEKQTKQHTDLVASWAEAAVKDKEIGGPDHDAKMATAGAVMHEFFEDEALEMLNNTGLGNHPAFLRGFFRMGLAFGEQITPRGGKGGKGSPTIVDALYGDA